MHQGERREFNASAQYTVDFVHLSSTRSDPIPDASHVGIHIRRGDMGSQSWGYRGLPVPIQGFLETVREEGAGDWRVRSSSSSLLMTRIRLMNLLERADTEVAGYDVRDKRDPCEAMPTTSPIVNPPI
ncbi:hypothetical protein BS47DRAFT_1484219 [Hydnum rufescens UP504]|uniref:Uncharacterized protein n=1 Tax=Hydnum rufescens UP504 TaxID=1448309 RepID=A0A9P6DZK6_9AGAM|nr:hypothetical protein BS47DRAFT_1484219 [Hydnum rufescens UP504]